MEIPRILIKAKGLRLLNFDEEGPFRNQELRRGVEEPGAGRLCNVYPRKETEL